MSDSLRDELDAIYKSLVVVREGVQTKPDSPLSDEVLRLRDSVASILAVVRRNALPFKHPDPTAAELVAKAREVVEVRARMKAGRSMDIAGLADQFDNAINSLAAALDAYEKGGAP